MKEDQKPVSTMPTTLRQRSSLGLESGELSITMKRIPEASVLHAYITQAKDEPRLESGELSLNMKRGPETSVLHAHLSQAKVEPMFREWIIITEYEKRTRTLKSAAKYNPIQLQ